MGKIYLPTEFVDKPCKVINNDYIRVYTNNNYTQWVDVFYNSNYMLRNGYSNYSTSPQCDTLNEFTDNIYYRNDLDSILVIFIIILIFSFYFPYRIIARMFGRWLRL